MLGSATQGANRARDVSRPSVDRRHLLIAAIRGEHAAGLVVEHDEIWILANRYFGDLRERIEIEDHDGPGVALADEAATELRRDRCAVHVGSATNAAVKA